jgi:hypothetical protein
MAHDDIEAIDATALPALPTSSGRALTLDESRGPESTQGVAPDSSHERRWRR